MDAERLLVRIFWKIKETSLSANESELVRRKKQELTNFKKKIWIILSEKLLQLSVKNLTLKSQILREIFELIHVKNSSSAVSTGWILKPHWFILTFCGASFTNTAWTLSTRKNVKGIQLEGLFWHRNGKFYKILKKFHEFVLNPRVWSRIMWKLLTR